MSEDIYENSNNEYTHEIPVGNSDFNYQQQYRHEYPRSYAAPSVRPKKKRLALKIVAICLACLIIGGAGGVGLGTVLKNVSIERISALPSTPPAQDMTSNPAAPGASSGGVPAPTTLPAELGTVNGNADGDKLSANEIYKRVCRSSVGVTTPITTTNAFGQTTTSAVSGSGFIITADGYILTNYHVVEDADKQGLTIMVMLFTGEEYIATIVGKEAENDVALLKIAADGLTPVTIGSMNNSEVGDTVYAIGNPLGELTYSFTSGIISSLDREINVDSSTIINMFQLDAAINSGNSGGPVINEYGEVIGIAAAKYASAGVEGLGFAIPIDDAMDIVQQLVTYGYVTGKPYFGITVQTLSRDFAQYYNLAVGAYVVAVDPNSCAAVAGLKVGDIITKVDDKEITSSSELVAAKKGYKPGDMAVLSVFRDGETITLTIIFDEAGAPPATSGQITG